MNIAKIKGVLTVNFLNAITASGDTTLDYPRRLAALEVATQNLEALQDLDAGSENTTGDASHQSLDPNPQEATKLQ